MNQTNKKAVVLLSGGLDSSTVLAIAAAEGFEIYGLSFDYGQRHRAELVAAARIAQAYRVKEYKKISLDLSSIGGSALTDANIAVPTELSAGIPVTYVPARNTVFLSIALGWAEVLHADSIFIGVNAVDYSGYPDCRPAYIQAFQQMANLATKAAVEGAPIQIQTPLLHLSKEDIIQAGVRLGLDYAMTVSCYQADDDGRACGLCDACRLRKVGFAAAGIDDPTRYRPQLV